MRMEDALRIRHYDRLPSSEEFSTEIEPSNVPAVREALDSNISFFLPPPLCERTSSIDLDDSLFFLSFFTVLYLLLFASSSSSKVFYGAVRDWEAITKWNPSEGGLDYLQERAGSAVVEAMLSKTAPVFYGDLGSHERVQVPFSTFITSCKSHQQEVETFNRHGFMDAKLTNSNEAHTSLSDIPDKIYLAQVPILNAENKESAPLEILRGDIEMPAFLGNKALASVNLWMNRACSRSSTHYDPHHNLLCIVAGYKQVILWPPCASPSLYPMPIFGEASNHSAVDLVSPDFSVHSRAKNLKEYSQKVALHFGDALFIPEGWFHQVDSHDITVAVNLWWKSSTISNMLEHMDAYYLRQILNRLVDKEMHIMLKRLEDGLKGEDHCPMNDALKGDTHFKSNDHRTNCEENSKKFILASDQLEPLELNVLYELVSLVHDKISTASYHEASGFTQGVSVISVESDHKNDATGCSSSLLNNPVASILWAVEPSVLQKVLLSMVNRFPRTLEGLVMHMLSPTAAEVLTRKFDEMDRETTKEQQSEFYQQFYSVFDDQYAAMDAILHRKESFSFQAFCNVLDKYLGVSVDETRTYNRRGRFRSDHQQTKSAKG